MILAAVREILGRAGIDYAVIGGMALAAHGHSRSTLDIDILTADIRALDETLWTSIRDRGPAVAVHVGDRDDHLRGVVRIRPAGERQIDVVVAKYKWEKEVIDRAIETTLQDDRIRVVRAGDLMLLKLAAGGLQDSEDIRRMLRSPDREERVAHVDAHIHRLPDEARARWTTLRDSTATSG